MAKALKLNDLHLILLSTAAQHAEGSVLPFAGSVTGARERLGRALDALLRHGLILEQPVRASEQMWREEDDSRIGLFLTAAGRAAIGAEEVDDKANEIAIVVDDAPAEPRTGTKSARVLDLLRRPEGATLLELITATGWLAHTTRAALTGLRKKGHDIERGKRDDVSVYFIGAEA